MYVKLRLSDSNCGRGVEDDLDVGKGWAKCSQRAVRPNWPIAMYCTSELANFRRIGHFTCKLANSTIFLDATTNSNV